MRGFLDLLDFSGTNKFFKNWILRKAQVKKPRITNQNQLQKSKSVKKIQVRCINRPQSVFALKFKNKTLVSEIKENIYIIISVIFHKTRTEINHISASQKMREIQKKYDECFFVFTCNIWNFSIRIQDDSFSTSLSPLFLMILWLAISSFGGLYSSSGFSRSLFNVILTALCKTKCDRGGRESVEVIL